MNLPNLCLSRNKKVIYLFIAVIIYIFFNLLTSNKITIEKSKKCYQFNENLENFEFLENILNSSQKPTIDTTIFFHDTSCTRDGRVSFTSRQACAIESAAKWNPNRDIFVLFTAPVGFVPSEPLSPILTALKNYTNIKFRTVDWYEYAKGTPAEEWIKEDRIFLSPFVKPHLSDFVRLLSLYHFGGIHFDLDFVMQQNLNDMPSNFAGVERHDGINNAVMGFESQGFGHDVVDMILRDNMKNYDPECWSCAGPDAVTRVLKKVCRSNHTADMTEERCSGVKVYQTPVFFPVPVKYWNMLFERDEMVAEHILEASKHSVAVHMWNSKSAGAKSDTLKQPKCAYQIISEINCPRVFQVAGRYI